MTGQVADVGVWPSKKSIRRMVEKVHAMTTVSATWQETTELVEQVESHATRLGELLQRRNGQARDRALDNYTLRGCAGGYATSTSSGVAGAGAIHPRTSTGTSVSCV